MLELNKKTESCAVGHDKRQPHAAESKPVSLHVGVVTFHSDTTHLRESLYALLESAVLAEESFALEVIVTVVINDIEKKRIAEIESIVASLQKSYQVNHEFNVIVGHGNIGYASGQNLAISSRSADYYLVLNPDLEMDQNTIVTCLDYLQRNRDASMVVPQGFDPNGNYARLAKRYPTIFVLLLRWIGVMPSDSAIGRSVGRYVYDDRLPTDQPEEIDLASGCFMFCRSEIWNKIVGFDERYFLYFEDYDLSIRIREHGVIIEHPDVKVVHHGGGTARFKPRRLLLFSISAIRFFHRHKWKWL